MRTLSPQEIQAVSGGATAASSSGNTSIFSFLLVAGAWLIASLFGKSLPY